MRMSCNGCRVLRKGCSEDCTLRPCLEWIRTPESQAHATVFLAKFYGRAGLLNLINAGPPHLRPEIFRSLLYEACGRIINPIDGSVGLMWSGNWNQCQSAVDSVLKGTPITQIPCDQAVAAAATAEHLITPFQGCDIRHLSKDSDALHLVRTRNRFKRSGGRDKAKAEPDSEFPAEPAQFSIIGWSFDDLAELSRARSHDSSSVQTVEASLLHHPEPERAKSESRVEESDIVLELTLGLNPVQRAYLSKVKELPDQEA
ncbi:hypothetical protein RJ640_017954 [Escallonia rubra]|uniref:LOB domain-containing protein n=1 Tax=Escallonia rubra TaxID=112253 RepID=A0AA88QY44_9ASTE|nr:hypothetical protein RJ640_017954 [Escallonia rubra]